MIIYAVTNSVAVVTSALAVKSAPVEKSVSVAQRSNLDAIVMAQDSEELLVAPAIIGQEEVLATI